MSWTCKAFIDAMDDKLSKVNCATCTHWTGLVCNDEDAVGELHTQTKEGQTNV